MNVADRFIVGVMELGEQHKSKAWSGVLKTKNMNTNQQQDSTTMDTNSTKQLKVIGQRKI
jgi:hypothetical protein